MAYNDFARLAVVEVTIIFSCTGEVIEQSRRKGKDSST